MTPRVLVGISTYNRADVLPKAIESALAQSHPATRVAVLDDGSTDATPALEARFPGVSWTRWPNQGYIPARNHLMLMADAEYYVSLDDDAWFLQRDEIAIAVEILESDRALGAVGFDILTPDAPAVRPRSAPVPAAMFIGCGHVLRLDLVRKLGGYGRFPGSYGGEEKDFCLRLLDAGYGVVRAPGVHVWHDVSQTARDPGAQHRSGVCNDLAVMLRRTPLAALPAAFAWKLARHTAFSLRAGLLDSCLAGFRAFIRAVPAIWTGREPVRMGTLRRFTQLARGGRREPD